MADTLNIQITQDGLILVTSDQVSITNHRSADELVKLLVTLSGKVVSQEKVQRSVHQQSQHQSTQV